MISAQSRQLLCTGWLMPGLTSRLMSYITRCKPSTLAPLAAFQQHPAGGSAPNSIFQQSALSLLLAREYAKGVYYPIPDKLIPILTKPREPTPQGEVPPLEPRPWAKGSKRCGVIAVKAGMTQDWNEWGVRVPVTVLWIDDCKVVQVKTLGRDNVTSLQLGAGRKRAKQMHPANLGEFRARGMVPMLFRREFRVTPDALLPVGTPISAAHFVAGQHVDITGVTKGKGFQGVMKRWGFKGMPATHGVSKAHRSAGATGARNDPGKIWKKKKMPGRMGHKQRTMHSVWIYKVDASRNLLYVRGQVPGPVGSAIYVRDAVRKPFQERQTLPFPTFIGPPPTDVAVAATARDPYHMYTGDTDYFPEKWTGSD